MASRKRIRDPRLHARLDAREGAACCGRTRCGVCHPAKRWPRPRDHRLAVLRDWVDMPRRV